MEQDSAKTGSARAQPTKAVLAACVLGGSREGENCTGRDGSLCAQPKFEVMVASQ